MSCEQGRAGVPCEVTFITSIPSLKAITLLPQEMHLLCIFFNLHLREALCYVIQFSILRTVFQPLSVWLNFSQVSDDGQFCDLGQVPARVVRSHHLVGHQLYCLFESVYSLLIRSNSWGAGGLTLNHILLPYTFNTPLEVLTLLLFTLLKRLRNVSPQRYLTFWYPSLFPSNWGLAIVNGTRVPRPLPTSEV